MGYDMILVGGTGAQFGQAVLESVGMGILAPPITTFVVDADTSFMPSLTASYKKFVLDPGPAALGARAGTETSTVVPTIDQIAPYLHQRANFTIMDLLECNALPPLGQLCLSEEESTHSVADGLYGMAKLGGIVVGLERSREGRTSVQLSNSFPDNVLSRLVTSATANPIVLAGSVAGGTGAGFLMPLLHAMRAEPRLAQRPIYCYLFLPWFSLPARPGAVGPNNLRMNRNASQGIRFAQRVMGLQAVRNCPAVTYTILFGMPPGTAKPERSAPDMRSEPGPLLYYAASLMSGDFEVFRKAKVAYDLPTGIYAVRCNPPGQPAFARRVRFSIEIRRDGADPELVSLPFEAAHALITAQEKALRHLANETRYAEAFGFIDYPDYLPKVIFRAIKEARNKTRERHEVGRRMAQRFLEMANDLKARADRLQSAVSAERGTLLFEDPARAGGDRPIVADWWDKNLERMDHLDRVIRRAPNIEAAAKNAVATNQIDLAAILLGRALRVGLASGADTLQALERMMKGQSQDSTSLALPVTDIQAAGRPGLPFSQLDDKVEQLARALVGTDQPDSQCVPSPLAKAHILDFFCTNSLQIDPNLTKSPPGLVILGLCGLGNGFFRIRQRLYLGGNRSDLDLFTRTVAVQEEVRGDQPVRSDWVALIRGPGDELIGGASPRTGLFYGVRVDETQTDPLLRLFEQLDRDLRARGELDALRSIYACFLEDLLRLHPGAANQPWVKVLQQWTQGCSLPAARDLFREQALYAVGPLPLQVGVDGDGNAQHAWVWLPKLCTPAQRERLACVLCSICVATGQVIQAVPDERLLRIQALVPQNPELLSLRPFGAARVALSPEEELRAGALELIDHYTDDRPVRGLYLEWKLLRDRVRLMLANVQRSPNPQFSAGSMLRLLRNNQPTLAEALGLDENRLNWVNGLTVGPCAPEIVNLFERLALK